MGRAVARALLTGPQATEADARIFEATIAVLARRGTREATMDDVAAESGVSRATLFRRFSGKDELFERALTREIGLLLAGLAQRFQVITDPTEQVIEGFLTCMRLNDHILFRTTDPERRTDLVDALCHGDPSPIALVHYAVRSNIAKNQAAGKIPPGLPDLQADALIHICIGYLAAPSVAIDLTDPNAVRTLARVAIAPILTGSTIAQ